MTPFERALDFIKTHEDDKIIITTLLEQLLVEANGEQITTALDNTEDFLTILNANK